MNFRTGLLFAFFALMLGGCATTPQSPLGLAQDSFSQRGGKVGVAMTPLPKIDTQFPGAGCLLCLAAASVANSSLTAHTQTLPSEGLPELKESLAQLIRQKGVEVFVIEDDIELNSLPDFGAKGLNLASKDFTSLRDKYRIDKLLLINVYGLGMVRTYSAYFPTSDPKAMFSALGYLVDLSSNRYEWYQPVTVLKAAEGAWDEPPKYPGLTNAYFQALESGKDDLLRPFTN
ncbi:hypothetical protein [Azoarcus indigens]|uniref:Uncharacterized protein n=1 Tax=Azoarcus indigens TaxID=29545 RepID=A0A4R6DH93_9RHOO|nr:hypothetical protein [Azoarcus indigens]TDN44096.1 hypothetical protein C7389_13613 [Azoarcus indigens]